MILTALGVSFGGREGIHKIRLAVMTTLGFSAFIYVYVYVYMGFFFFFNLKKETMKRKEEKSGDL